MVSNAWTNFVCKFPYPDDSRCDSSSTPSFDSNLQSPFTFHWNFLLEDRFATPQLRQ